MVVTAPSATVHTVTPQVGVSHPTAGAKLAMNGMSKYHGIKYFPMSVLVYAHLFTCSQGFSCEKLEKTFGCTCEGCTCKLPTNGDAKGRSNNCSTVHPTNQLTDRYNNHLTISTTNKPTKLINQITPQPMHTAV